MWTTFWLVWLVGSIVAGSAVAIVCLFGGILDMIGFIKDLKEAASAVDGTGSDAGDDGHQRKSY